MDRRFPTSALEFRAAFPDDAACREYLVERRWPEGFRCPGCGGGAAWQRARMRLVCRRCRRETSVTAGTALDRTRVPLVTWFLAIYLVSTTPGLSALSLGRQLGLSSRETAYSILRRLRRSMSALALSRSARAPSLAAGPTEVGGFDAAGDAGDDAAGDLAGDPGIRSQFDRWLLATYRRRPKDARPYLDEFRFHATFDGDPATAFSTLVGLAMLSPETNPVPDQLGDQPGDESKDRPRDKPPFATRPALAAASPAASTPAAPTPAAPTPAASTPAAPSRASRVAARRAMLAFTGRRQRPGSGSVLDELMRGRRHRMEWWRTAVGVLEAATIKVALAGAVAANAYMPPRQTADLDLALQITDLDDAGEALQASGWSFLGDLTLYENLRGTAWKSRRHELDLIGIPGALGADAVLVAQDNRVVAGLPTLTLPYIVALKLISARPQDTADISRMLGSASRADLDAVRVLVKRERPADADDLDQMIVAGQLEFGAGRR